MAVPKKNGKIRVCIDFTDLNRACPKDSFPILFAYHVHVKRNETENSSSRPQQDTSC